MNIERNTNSAETSKIYVDTVGATKRLESTLSLRGLHWAIISLSLILTFAAWYYAQSQHGARIQVQFDREER